jgi:hypothetical protein
MTDDQSDAKDVDLVKLARQTLHLAWVYNDHNFEKSAKQMARDISIECGIRDLDEANEYLSAMSAKSRDGSHE